MLNTPVKRLIQNGVTKEIVGVIAESGGKRMNIKAKKAVIMACGGFSANREMTATYIESVECPVNTINTQGGFRRNAKSQVMKPYGEPIPRLYAGGEFGSIWGSLYPGACNLPECINRRRFRSVANAINPIRCH